MCYLRRCIRLALIALATLVTVSQPAAARQLKHHLHRQVAPRSEQRAEVSKPPTGPLFAVVSIADQHVSFYDANGLWAQSTVSTGVSAYPTPTGVFTILEKERWHRSNIYSGAPMPFMQRLTWTGVALHEGMVTGHPASHGCIRLPGDFARHLFSVTNAGQRVIVSAEDVFPVNIAHAHLPTPELLVPPSAMDEAANAGHGGKSAEPIALGASAAQAKELSAQAPVNPLEFAKALKAAAETRASAAI
ncbi:MAG: L,D-transpeptidase family protein, partial [Rhodomicrobium sp.]